MGLGYNFFKIIVIPRNQLLYFLQFSWKTNFSIDYRLLNVHEIPFSKPLLGFAKGNFL